MDIGKIILSISQAVLAAVGGVLAEHYVPWGDYLSGHPRLRLVANYALGLLAIYVPFTLMTLGWTRPYPAWLPVLALWIISMAAGLAVIASHMIDTHKADRARADQAETCARQAKEREDQLRRNLRGENDQGTAE